MRLARRDTRKARIEIIPMIDTVFFLLVFFMIASLSMAAYHGMPVNLPKAATGRPTRDDTAAITLSRDGRTYLDHEAIAPTALSPRLRSMVTANPGLVVVINADGEVLHHRVVEAVDAARAAGAARVAIAVAPAEAPRQP